MPRHRNNSKLCLRRGARPLEPTRNELLALGHAPASCLSLPVLDREVPLQGREGNGYDTAIARALISGGILRPEHWPEGEQLSVATIRAVDQWLEWPSLGQLAVSFSDDCQRETSSGFEFQFAGYPERLDRRSGKIGYLSVIALDSRFRLLQRRWEELNRLVPKLAPTVFNTLAHALSMAVGIVDPAVCLQFAMQWYWSGGRNEKEAVEMWGDTAPAEEMYQRAEWEATMPVEAYEFWQKSQRLNLRRLSARQLRRRMRSTGRRVREIVELALELDRQIERLKQLRDPGSHHAGLRVLFNDIGCIEEHSDLCAPYFFRWNDEDHCFRMIDMQWDMDAQSAAVSDLPFLRLFDVHDPADVLHAFTLAREVLKTCRLAEPLIEIISEPEDRRRG
jgi:PRTRC genetic system protein F